MSPSTLIETTRGIGDHQTDDFSEIVTEVAIAAGLDPRSLDRQSRSSNLTSRSNYHLDIGFSPILIDVAARCRDPTVRRQAIALMLAAQEREGL
jgi:hypothetical protein